MAGLRDILQDRNREGLTALEIAGNCGNINVTRYLKNAKRAMRWHLIAERKANEKVWESASPRATKGVSRVNSAPARESLTAWLLKPDPEPKDTTPDPGANWLSPRSKSERAVRKTG